jgi:hypothetical protein
MLVFAGAASAQHVKVFEGMTFADVAPAPRVDISAFAGQTVRIRIEAFDASLGALDLSHLFVIQSARSKRIGCNLSESFPASVETTSNLTYSGESGGMMEYDWKTERTWSGTCRAFSIGLMDGSVRSVSMSFR